MFWALKFYICGCLQDKFAVLIKAAESQSNAK